MAASAESDDALDGEEITNKIPGIYGWGGELSKANHSTDEMCLIQGDYKHFHAGDIEDFRPARKVSSIM